ncbi:Zinc finger, RING/FYVE/PHD-type [Phytophthora cinnamomi]|uniref:Zinc finger, RING/FYVE/PHD-type n=1 Tax=Phytophthora cinnamomi TaxID=4785 RepID=UPI003559F60D|nr:Zinc finger, RING/FYVE/PHD-type [Phytophthora cinnamomi]
MSLAPVDDEQHARLCGRARAKEIFQPMRWKRIGALPDEAAKLYESARRSSNSSNNRSKSSYSLRAVRPLQASLAEVEAVLTGQTALLGRDDTPSLLARLLPATYVSGGRIARFPTLEHSTSERENVALQYARLKPYSAQHQQESKHAVLLESVDNHVLLGYTLSTKLQRSDTSKRKQAGLETPAPASVPSLLHLYRPVSAPAFAERRHDFRADRLATSEFSITYIIQELPPNEDEEQQKESSVTLEVVLTCSLDPQQPEAAVDDEAKELLHQQKQRLRHDALCLTRLQPFIDAYRQEKTRGSVAVTQTREPQHDPKDCDPNMLRGSMFSGGRTCGVCHRKFGPFRWKRHCESCEKIVCNQCLSVLAAAPSLSRRKKRVCSQCLYGETANVAAMHKAAADAAHEDGPGSAKTQGSSETTTMNVFQFPSLESLVTKHKASRPADPVATSSRTSSRSSGRVQIDLGLDPALAMSSRSTSDRRRARSRQSQLSQGSVVSTTSNTSATSSFVTATPDNRRVTLADRTDLDDTESAMTKSMRTRRAKTVLLDEPQTKPVTRKHLNFITPLSASAPTHSLYSTSEEEKEEEELLHVKPVTKPRASSCQNSMMQFVQLRTPEPDYELDFSWYNIFPKAPVDRTATEMARAKYVEVSGLKVDAHSLVFMRHDTELEELARRVLTVASQWHGCSINIVGSYEVHCLVTASNKPELDLDDELLELEASPVTVDDIVPREESVSAYAVHHRSPFFVAEMEHDPRFRAHPLHTEQGAVSFLSFPIYSSGADTSGSLSTDGEAYCVATLDLWKRDHVPASSHVSHEWMASVGDLLRSVSARLEALSLESHAFLKPRSRAGHSFGSSCDSRSSTRRADSIVDLYDIDSESVVDSPPLSQAETMDRLTNLSYAKVRGIGLGGMSGPGSSTWKYDSDNESTTSSQSASSQSSRFSSHLYTAADMHSTIESLLQQASKTSKYISETGVSI